MSPNLFALWPQLLYILLASISAEVFASKCDSQFAPTQNSHRYKHAVKLIDNFDFANVFEDFDFKNRGKSLYADLRARYQLSDSPVQSLNDFRTLLQLLNDKYEDFLGFSALVHKLIETRKKWVHPLELKLGFRYFQYLSSFLSEAKVRGAIPVESNIHNTNEAILEFRNIVEETAIRNAMPLICMAIENIANQEGDTGLEMATLLTAVADFEATKDNYYSEEMLTVFAAYLLGHFDKSASLNVKTMEMQLYKKTFLDLFSLSRPLIIGQNRTDLTPYLFGLMVKLSRVARGRVRLLRMLQTEHVEANLAFELKRFIEFVAVQNHPMRMHQYLELINDERSIVGEFGRDALKAFIERYPFTTNDAFESARAVAGDEIKLSSDLSDLIEAHWASYDQKSNDLLEQLMQSQDLMKSELGARLFVKSLRSKAFEKTLNFPQIQRIIERFPGALRDKRFTYLSLSVLTLEEIPDFLRRHSWVGPELKQILGNQWQSIELNEARHCSRSWTNAERKIIDEFVGVDSTNIGLIELHYVLLSCDPNISAEKQIAIVDRAAAYAAINLPQYALKNLTKNLGLKKILESINEYEISASRLQPILNTIANMSAGEALPLLLDMLRMQHLYVQADAQKIADLLNSAAKRSGIWSALADNINISRKSSLDFTIAALMYLSSDTSTLGIRNDSFKELAIQARSDDHIFGRLLLFKSDKRRETAANAVRPASNTQLQPTKYSFLRSLIVDHRYDQARQYLVEHQELINRLTVREIAFFTRFEYDGERYREAKFSEFDLRLMRSLSLNQLRDLIVSEQKHAYMFATIALLWRAKRRQDQSSERSVELLMRTLEEGLRLGTDRGKYYRQCMRTILVTALAARSYQLSPPLFGLVFSIYKQDEASLAYKDKLEKLAVLSLMRKSTPEQRSQLIDFNKELIRYDGAPESPVFQRWLEWRRMKNDRFYAGYRDLIELITEDFLDPSLDSDDFTKVLSRLAVNRREHFQFYAVKSLTGLKVYAREKAATLVEQRFRQSADDVQTLRLAMEEVSIAYVIVSELENGRIPYEVDGDEFLGYDVLSLDPANGERRQIEVKAKFSDIPFVWSSSAQLRACLKAKNSSSDDFYFYTVSIDGVAKDESIALQKYKSPDAQIYGRTAIRDDEHWRIQIPMVLLKPYLHD